MIKKKGSFSTAIYDHHLYRAFSVKVDGYLFEYQGVKFGLYKKNDKCFRPYKIIDLKSGLSIASMENMELLESKMQSIFDKYLELIKTSTYKRKTDEMDNLEARDINISCYHWMKKS